MSRRVFQRLDKLEIPPRAKLTIGGKEPCRGYGPFHGFDSKAPKIFRLTWTHQLGIHYAGIQKYEVFACVQRIRSAEISQWRKIAEIVPRVKKESNACRLGEDVKKAVSRRMTGFDAGFRYQLVVRGVDVLGREGPFCKPVSVGI